MKKHIYKLLPLILISSTALASNYQDKEKLPLEATKITYKFLANDYDGQVTDQFTIMANISKAILDDTKYPTIAKKAPCSSWSSEEKCAIRTGTYITIGKDKIIVEYQNVKNEAGAITASLIESDIYNNLSFDIPVTVHNEESYVIATLVIPNEVEINSSNMSLTRYKPLDTSMNLRSNLISILESQKISLSKYHIETGEIDNQYTIDSVYGNLGRLLGKYDWNKFPSCNVIDKIMTKASDIKDISTLDVKSCMPDNNKLTELQQKSQENFIDKWDISSEQMPTTYRYRLNDEIIPINIVAYPYHNSSKASYKAIVPYVMNSNGGISIDKANINLMEKAIESAVGN